MSAERIVSTKPLMLPQKHLGNEQMLNIRRCEQTIGKNTVPDQAYSSLKYKMAGLADARNEVSG